ncbi:cyclodeaminase [Sporosarcina sp. Marseille-Q4063]|uniref:cyclodeaminase n=1 Tax=Sporosarcina sp. Marseille-Q4063 TaxID=2810514 RepID=UPI001BB00494|nr:cyclodeaminase [Sporosarcina sp. Marseille-Q4063]QUW22551.1 cyclodeaminase [Sporosarcina sp. Marseille-Q4063]
MIIFTEEEIRSSVKFGPEVVAVVEDAFTQLATKKVIMPPIMRVDVEENNGEVDVKTAYITGKDVFALKVSSGFFNNPQLGLPSANGFMALISTITGQPEAFLLDNGYLTEIRTAAAGAVAAKYLAKEQVTTVGVIGTGAQARYQMKALKTVRDFKEILVYGRSEQNVKDFQKEMESALNVKVIATNNPEQIVRDSEIVVTTTPAKEPIIKAEWLHPGLHITAMGSDAETKQELEADVLKNADRYVCDVQSQCATLGELHHAVKQGIFYETDQVIELGEITAGKVPGRLHDEEVTVCDLTGTGIQDTAIAIFAFELLKKMGTSGLFVDNQKELSFL